MTPIEIGPLRPVVAIPPRNEDNPVSAQGNTARSASSPSAAVETGKALDPGKTPVDVDRVAEVRNAIEQGRYPLVPARTGDAMIAAGILLRTS